MKITISCVTALLCACLWQVSPAGQIPTAALSAITNSVSLKIRALAPEAIVVVTNDVLEIKHKTRPYTIHRFTGEIAQPAEDPAKLLKIQGPESSGYLISARVGTGNPDKKEPLSRLALPNFEKSEVTKRVGFFETMTITKFPEANRYLVIDVSFGETADVQSVSNIFSVVKTTLSETIGSK